VSFVLGGNMGDRPEIVYKDIKSIKPYERNPRKNDSAVDSVAESIKQFGFKVPVVIDKDGTIVCGHTRYKAAKKLGIDEIPCIVADDLTEEQITAYRHIA
jgi:ParB-like chromosome segregation protein Spo0J